MPEQEATKIENKKFDENAKNTINSIDKLLSMAEESEAKISKYEQNKFFIVFTFFAAIPALLLIPFNLLWYNFSYFDISLLVTVEILLVAMIFLLTVRFLEVIKNKQKEVITFKESLGVVQELLPYYFDNMSVLEKTIYKIRLSKLDIVAIESNQEDNDSFRNEFIKVLIKEVIPKISRMP